MVRRTKKVTMAARAGSGAGARAEQQLQRDFSVSYSGSLSGSVGGGVSGSVRGNVGGCFSSSNLGSQIDSGSGIMSWARRRSSSVTEAVLVAAAYSGAPTRASGASVEASAEAVAVSAAVLVGGSIGHLMPCRSSSM